MQFANEAMCHISSILSALACADDAENVLGFEVDVTKLEKYGGSIWTTQEALWIAILTIDEGLNMMCFDKSEFAFGIDLVLRVVTAIDDHLSDSARLEKKAGVGIEDSFGAAECIDEMTGSDGTYATDGVQNEEGKKWGHGRGWGRRRPKMAAAERCRMRKSGQRWPLQRRWRSQSWQARGVAERGRRRPKMAATMNEEWRRTSIAQLLRGVNRSRWHELEEV